jgi:hypothetical protein
LLSIEGELPTPDLNPTTDWVRPRLWPSSVNSFLLDDWISYKFSSSPYADLGKLSFKDFKL